MCSNGWQSRARAFSRSFFILHRSPHLSLPRRRCATLHTVAVVCLIAAGAVASADTFARAKITAV